MRKVKEIIGLPVLTFDTGRKVADVHDVLFEPEQNRVLALLIDRGGWFESAKVVPFGAIKSIGEDAVIIPDVKAVVPVNADPRTKRALDGGKVVSGMDIYTSDGTHLGKVADMVIDESTGEVKGYEVTGGLVEETMRGKKFVPAPETIEVGKEVLFVPPETGERVRREVTGGIQKATEEAKTSAQRAAEEARGRGEEALGRAREEFGRASEEVTRASVEQQKRYVIGKRAESTIIGPGGAVIVREGEIISAGAADEAERQGVLTKLVTVAGGAEARGTMDRVREEASGAFEDVRRAFQELTGRAQERTLEERVRSALGRPVTRVILDRNDQVILNTGEIVTHRAIELAQDAGVLDILLDSVSKREPELGPEQRMAPRPGEARLRERDPDKK